MLERKKPINVGDKGVFKLLFVQIYVGKFFFMHIESDRTHPTLCFFTCTSKFVVYMATCSSCESFYIGKMNRELRKRV